MPSDVLMDRSDRSTRRYGTMSLFDRMVKRLAGYMELDDSEERAGISAMSREDEMREISRMKGISLYEKKCLLINKEIDAMGMGRYQCYLWLLCAMGYYIDLLWAATGGYILQPVIQEFALTGPQIGGLGIASSIGTSLGAAFWGIAVDVIGRWWSFNLTCLLPAIFGTLQGTAINFPTFMLMSSLCGFGIGGNIPLDTTIILEFLPQNKRWLLAGLSVFQTLGVVTTLIMAYVFIPNNVCSPNFTEPEPLPSCRLVSPGTPCCGRGNNMGWRYTIYGGGFISAIIFVVRIVFFSMQESPKWLVHKGYDDLAIQSLKNVSQINKRTCGLTLNMFETLTHEHDGEFEVRSGNTVDFPDARTSIRTSRSAKFKAELARIKTLFATWDSSRLFILVALVYMCDYYGFSASGAYTPALIALKGGALNVGLKETYRYYFAITLPSSLGVVLGVLSYRIPYFGRKGGMVVSSACMGAAIMGFARVNTRASNVWLNTVAQIAQVMFNAILYGWTPEAFPAPIRGTASGLCSTCGRIAAILAPFSAALLLPLRPEAADYEKIVFLAGAVTMTCVLWLLLIPTKLMGGESL